MKLTHKKIVVFSSIGIAALAGLSLLLAYCTSSRDPLTVSFKRLYPAMMVGNRLISINDLEQSRTVAASFGVGQEQADRRQVNTEKSIMLARDMSLRVSNDQLADETLFYTKGNTAEYRALLAKHYEGSEREFYKFVIIPQAADAQLRMKFYNDINDTSPAYKKAQDVLERLSKGEKFEDLAKAESADQATAQLGGDLGFYETGQLLPELEDQVSVSATGEYRKDIITSRLGYHLIYPVQYSNTGGKKLWHVKHILFVPDGYSQWLDQQLEKIGVKVFLK